MKSPDQNDMHTGASDPVGFLYTPLEEAAAELRRRREDKSLSLAVKKFQQNHPPEFMGTAPVLALVRPIFTADDELESLIRMAESVSFSPLCVEFCKDRFVSLNADKNSLCKLSFAVKTNVRKLRIIDFHKYDGQPFSEIRTLSGQRLVDFHHCLIERAHPDHNFTFTDCSDWVCAFDSGHMDYLPYLGLFVTHGILLENFLWGDELERKFTEERVIPAFEKIVELFGVKPLIVRTYSAEEESDPKHWQYDGSLYAFAKELLENPPLSNK